MNADELGENKKNVYRQLVKEQTGEMRAEQVYVFKQRFVFLSVSSSWVCFLYFMEERSLGHAVS